MSKAAYYNEKDPFCAQWLRNLIAAGHIAFGDVDERSIEDVLPSDLAGYGQCHFFAGIGIWSLALRSAGVPDDYPVWTGSCPCQPFSAAGKGAGFDDERHLWPAFHHLVRICKPSDVIGEQVASKVGLTWLELVQADLEAAGYAVGASDLCAAGFADPEITGAMGGAHIRQRLYWGGKRLGDSNLEGSQGRDRRVLPERPGQCAVGASGASGRLAYSDGGHPGAEWEQRSGQHGLESENGGALRMADTLPAGRAEGWAEPRDGSTAGSGAVGGLSDSDCEGLRPRDGHLSPARYGKAITSNSGVDWLPCRDGKYRPTKSGLFPLVDAYPGRVGVLRASGNALDKATAQAFVEAWFNV